MIGTALLLAASVLGTHALLGGDVTIADGVKLVSVPISNSLEESGRSLGEDSVLVRMAKFLQGHELRVSLPSLVEREKLGLVFGEALRAVDENGANAVSGRGKGGGGGAAALLALMFAKTLGAVGLGALALLTLKALALSALALVLSAIVGAKKMHSGDDHEDHQVIYAGHHGHHRRRRDVPIETPLPYQGWKALSPERH